MFRRSVLAVLAVAFVVPASAKAQQPAAAEKGSKAMAEVSARSLDWQPANIPGFVPGMQLAVVSGDPGKDGPYTMRLRFPSGYAFPSHWHPKDENLTVLSGKFLLGMGAKTDVAALKTYGPGDYLFMPATMPHFGRVEGETIIQLHGVGPFDITVVEAIAGAIK
jgi:quercetin dioxygenase-like cupin family protein